ncbi:AraC family transcriptional regulator [Porticoccaceae bacterium]|nr:AraC family transcriptional regulator [Porticoccaceae bacterium]
MDANNKFPLDTLTEQQREFMLDISPQSHFLSLLDSIDNTAIFFKNTQGDIIFGNQSLIKSLGIKNADTLKLKDKDIFPDYLVEKYQRDDQEVITEQQPKQFIIELFKNKQGILGWFVTHKYPVFDREHNVIGVMGCIQEYKTITATAHYAEKSILDSSQYIQQHFQEPICIKDLSIKSNMPIRQYQRHFKRVFNVSPQEYIIRHRLHYACEALRKTQLTIAKVAIEAGFYDQSSFTRQFRKYMYTTPLKYRKALLCQ